MRPTRAKATIASL